MDPKAREALIIRALDGRTRPEDETTLAHLAAEDPALAELLEGRHAALENRVHEDAALSPRGPGQAVQWAGVAGFGAGVLGLYLSVFVPVGLSLTLMGGGALAAVLPSVVARMKNRDPYGTIDQ